MAADGYRALLKRYAGYAPNYDRRWGRYTQTTLNHALEAAPISQSTALLDVACGTGVFASMALQVNGQLNITGVDMTPEMLEKARQRIPPAPRSAAQRGVQWLPGRAESLPVESGAFDLVCCNNAFHLMQDQAAALREFHRALEPGGTLVIVDWCSDHPTMRLLLALLRFGDQQRRRVLRLAELTAMVQEAGFGVTRAERFKASWFWGLMCVVARRT